MVPTGIKYYRFKNEQKYRYFRIDWDNQRCTVVNVWAQKKGGRPNVIGVYSLSWPTWQGVTHFVFKKYIKETTKGMFNFYRDKIINEIT